jgi:hypothetical protein
MVLLILKIKPFQNSMDIVPVTNIEPQRERSRSNSLGIDIADDDSSKIEFVSAQNVDT